MASEITTRLPANFARLAWSNLAAQSAEQIGLAAAPLVAVLAFGAGAGQVGLLQAAQTLPFLLLAIPAGLLADRMARRRLMAAAESLRVLALLGILVCIGMGWLSLPLLALLGFVAACGTVTYSVAAPALVPALVPPRALAVANGRIELARTVAFAAGPALAGVLVGLTGAGPAFGLAAALSACAVALLAGLREPARATPPPRNPLREVAEGIGFVLRHSLLLPVFLTQLIFNTAFFMLLAVYVPYAVSHLHLSASGVGATLAAYGIGMVVGALLAPRILRKLTFGKAIALGPLAGLAAALTMAATVWLPSALLAGLSFFLMGVGPIVWVISTTTLRQLVTPPQLLGRVSAINVLAQGARPVGAALGALIGGLYGAEACIVAAALGFGLQAALILATPVVRLATQPRMVGEQVPAVNPADHGAPGPDPGAPHSRRAPDGRGERAASFAEAIGGRE
jgi:predicted MFS family arabinose efflux permease